MRLWVGDLDNPSNINSSIGRSFFLGDRGKGSYQAHMGYFGVRVKF
jgi:hypothetical protein